MASLIGPLGGQLGLAVGAGGGLVWAGSGWEALVTAAAALAAAKATAKGMEGLEGKGSHLDLFSGLPDSPSSSCVDCRVLLGAWIGLAGLGPVLGEVLVEVESLILLPALTQVLGDGSAGTATSTVAATSVPCVAAAAPTAGVPERYFVST